MRTFIYVIICLLFLITSCKKDNKYLTIVKGKVINAGSKLPIDSVLAVMRDGVASGGGWFDLGMGGNTSSDKMSFAYTDKNGYFEIALSGEHSANISFKKKQYHYEYHAGGAVIGFKSFSDGKYENEVFEMEADSYFKGIFCNKNSLVCDSLFIYLLSYRYRDSEFDRAPGNPQIGIGPFDPYGSWEDGITTIGDKFLRFKLEFKSVNRCSTIIDSVYIKSFEKFRDTIYY